MIGRRLDEPQKLYARLAEPMTVGALAPEGRRSRARSPSRRDEAGLVADRHFFSFGPSSNTRVCRRSSPEDARTVRACVSVLLAILLFALETGAQDSAVDRAALVALYNATGGANWDNNTNWLSPAPMSVWYGVTVAGGRVIELHLGDNELTGTMPTELGHLANLRELWLYSNELTGAIPAELGNLANLQELWLSSNELTGTIPTELGNLAELQILRLSINQLTGAIPSELGNLANLRELEVDSNRLTGAIPSELGSLANLEELRLGSNRLTGTIPSRLGNLASLWMLSLEENRLTGPIPSQFGALADLHTLRLYDNQLTGSIPPQLGNLADLRWLSLGTNQLTGPIPSELGNLASLVGLYLHNNQLTGTVPPSLARLEALNNFFFNLNVGLCAEDDSSIQAWLDGVTRVRGPDCSPTVRLSVDPSRLVEGDAATDITVTATRTAVDSPTSVSLRGGGSAKPATSGMRTTPDYRLRSYSVSAAVIDTDGSFTIGNVLTIPANRTSATTTLLTLTPLADDRTEGDEYIILEAVVGDETAGSAVITLSEPRELRPAVLAATPYSLTVSWGEPAGGPFTDYDVRYRLAGSGGAFTDVRHEGTARNATITGLAPDTDYEIQVRARNASGPGEWSGAVQGKTKALLPGVTDNVSVYYFPHLAVGAGWQTTITYINYSTNTVTCQTHFIADDGGALTVSYPLLGAINGRNDVLRPGATVHEETNVDVSGPLAPGWALAACSGPVKASVLFRAYDSASAPTGEAGVNAAAIPATRFVTFAEQAAGQAGTGVAYANPSSATADLTFTARDTAGRIVDRQNLAVSPGGHGAQNMASLFGVTAFDGSLEVTSTEPVVSLALNVESDPVFSSLPPGEPDAGLSGPTTYYFPHLAVGAGWQTTITYINYSSAQVVCRTDFVSDNGGPLQVSFPRLGVIDSRSDTLPSRGSVHAETDVPLDDALAPGWARAACSGPVKASLLFRAYDSAGEPTGEAGVNAAAVPAKRFVTFAEQAAGQPGTGVAYANPSASRSASVEFTARNEAGDVIGRVMRTLLPQAHDAQNMEPLFGDIPFVGSLEVTSDEPIVVLSLNFEALPVFSSLPPGEVP